MTAIVLAGSASAAPVEFASPATSAPTANVYSGEWALVILSPADRIQGNVQLAGVTEIERREYTLSTRDPTDGRMVHQAMDGPSSSKMTGDIEAQLQSYAYATIFVMAEEIHWNVDGFSTELRSRSNDGCVSGDTSFADVRSARFNELCPQGNISIWSKSLSHQSRFSLEARGIQVLEVHGVGLNCAGNDACPTGRDVRRETLNQGQLTFQREERLFHELLASDGALDVTGSALEVGGSGPKLRLTTVGDTRFPLASGAFCEGCIQAADQSVRVRGRVSLHEISSSGPSKLHAEVEGNVTLASLDEIRISPALLFGGSAMGASASLAGLVLLGKLLAPLFTRLSKDQALEHPRRKQIFDYIQQHPGANFREIARNTGIAAGTVRHHLNVMVRSDILLEHQHGSTVRLFENLSRYHTNWADHVLLREPALGDLYAWLKDNPGSPQKAVLEGMEPHGWSRSTTQHRLSRLVAGGLATIKLQGRLKMYTAVDRSAKPPPPSFGSLSPSGPAPA